jgi:hypothetical protein
MKKKQAFILVGILGVVLAYGASRFVGWSEENEPASNGPESAELRKLREQLRQLEGSVAGSERLAREAQATARNAQAIASQRMEAPPAPTRGSGPAGQGGSDEGIPTKDSMPLPPEPSPREIAEQMDERFFGEWIDPGWRHEATPRAEKLRATLPEGARVVSLECRSSMCRVEMSHPNLEAFQGFVRESLLGSGREWDGPLMATLMSDPGQPGEVRAVAYLAREGADLTPAPREGR